MEKVPSLHLEIERYSSHQRQRTWGQGSLWKQTMKVQVLVAQSTLTLCDPMDCSPPGSSVHGPSRQKYWSGLPFFPPGNLPHPGIKPTYPTLEADSLPSEPPGKSKNKHCCFFNSLPQAQILLRLLTHWTPKAQVSLPCQFLTDLLFLS